MLFDDDCFTKTVVRRLFLFILFAVW